MQNQNNRITKLENTMASRQPQPFSQKQAVEGQYLLWKILGNGEEQGEILPAREYEHSIKSVISRVYGNETTTQHPT